MLAFYILNFFAGLVVMLGGIELVESTDLATAIIGGMVTTIGILAMGAFTIAINNHLSE